MRALVMIGLSVVPFLAQAQDEPVDAPAEAVPAPATEPAPEPLAGPVSDASPEQTLTAKISGQLICGESREIFQNERATGAQVGVVFNCDCGPGSYAALVIEGGWGEKEVCKREEGNTSLCAADIPAGGKLRVKCDWSAVPEADRKPSHCGYSGSIEH